MYNVLNFEIVCLCNELLLVKVFIIAFEKTYPLIQECLRLSIAVGSCRNADPLVMTLSILFFISSDDGWVLGISDMKNTGLSQT